MQHTFEYKSGYYIHERIDNGVQEITWQGPNYQVHSANSVHSAKMQITREIKMRQAGAEIC